jgi:hypothetical protein
MGATVHLPRPSALPQRRAAACARGATLLVLLLHAASAQQGSTVCMAHKGGCRPSLPCHMRHHTHCSASRVPRRTPHRHKRAPLNTPCSVLLPCWQTAQLGPFARFKTAIPTKAGPTYAGFVCPVPRAGATPIRPRVHARPHGVPARRSWSDAAARFALSPLSPLSAPHLDACMRPRAHARMHAALSHPVCLRGLVCPIPPASTHSAYGR